MVAVKFAVKHPQRVISTTIGGMGWFRDGSLLQQIWDRVPVRENARTPAACIRAIGKLAVSEVDLKGIRTPAIVIVGDRDPVRRLYVTPLESVRKDWRIIEIEDAGHLNCIAKPRFAEAIVEWLEKNSKEPSAKR
jgi:pimeloyl-ACP methyl ester carboxylesterase